MTEILQCMGIPFSVHCYRSDVSGSYTLRLLPNTRHGSEAIILWFLPYGCVSRGQNKV